MSAIIKVTELADRLGVSPSAVRRWLANGAGPPHLRTPGGSYRFDDPEALESWIRSLKGHSSETRRCDDAA